MNNRLFLLIVIAVSVSFCSISCKKADMPAEEPSAEGYYKGDVATEDATPEPGKQPKMMMEKSERESTGADDMENDERGLLWSFLAPMDLARGRLLEYKVNLGYECDDLLKSRMELLNLVSKYGYIGKSSANADIYTPYVDAVIYVKSEMLYDALKDFTKLGVLNSEEINVVDHTEDMVKSERRVNREQIRIVRRNRAMGQAGALSKNWQAVENALQQSEDNMDNAEHEKWKIRDRISWAEISVYLKGPDKPYEIDVPRYSNALIGLVNLFLRLVYGIIWLIPFLALALFILWKRRMFIDLFRMLKK